MSTVYSPNEESSAKTRRPASPAGSPRANFATSPSGTNAANSSRASPAICLSTPCHFASWSWTSVFTGYSATRRRGFREDDVPVAHVSLSATAGWSVRRGRSEKMRGGSGGPRDRRQGEAALGEARRDRVAIYGGWSGCAIFSSLGARQGRSRTRGGRRYPPAPPNCIRDSRCACERQPECAMV